MQYQISELAELAGVSVRTLRYYDEIGLLKPAGTKKNGYRFYSKKELMRLQQILFFREFDLPLDEIKKVIDGPEFEITKALKIHKKMLRQKQARLEKLIQTIDKTIKHMTKNATMKDEELYDPFRDEDAAKYQTEAKLRWGRTDAYRQSMIKVKSMTKAEMSKLKEEGEQLAQKLAGNMDKGASHPDFQALVAMHYESIKFFYDCPLDMYRNLGNMYVQDSRFRSYYDKYKPGLAKVLNKGIEIYCDSQK